MENKIREYEQKIEALEKKIAELENRNAGLHKCLIENVQFSTKLSNITYEMDCLLVKKGEEIRDLEKKLNESSMRISLPVSDEMLTDFDIEMNDDAPAVIAESRKEGLNANDNVKILEASEPKLKKDSKGYFNCSECNYKTRTTSNFELHHRMHTGERPFQCKLCDKTFAQKTSCIQHIRGHDDRFKLKCTVCNAKFVHVTSLINHTKKHHDGEGYTRKRRIFKDDKSKRRK